MTTPAALRVGNLHYREPELYDAVADGDSLPRIIYDLARQHVRPTRPTLLDVGCGTGYFARRMHERACWSTVGIDVQPQLIDFARRQAPHLTWHTTDLCSLRLNESFDVITCLGNTLAYLADSNDLDRAFGVFRAHAHSNTLLAISTLDQKPHRQVTSSKHEVDTVLGRAIVSTTSEWDEPSSLITTERVWTFATGRAEIDRFTRRVWPRLELQRRAVVAGFESLGANDELSVIAQVQNLQR